MMLRDRFGRPCVVVGNTREREPVGIGRDLGLAAPAAELVQEAEVRDLENPRPRAAAGGIEARGVPPDDEEDLLNEVLRRGAVERLDRQAEDRPGEASV